MYDVIIVGAGPAGLSAALILGRCRRRVLVLDSGQPRNAAAHELHGYLTRDCVPPGEMLRLGREQLRQYETVELRDAEAHTASRGDDFFDVTLANGERCSARILLLATGMVDDVPEVAGAREFYGHGVHHCPYCDGWEHRDQPIVIYGRGHDAAGLALELTVWSRDLTLCADGAAELSAKDRERLARHGVAVREERVDRLEGRDGWLARVVFSGGEAIPAGALFFAENPRQRCDLPEALGCEFTASGAVRTGEHEVTNVPGLYVAGDASRRVQLAIIAAAEGAGAAFAINTALLERDLAR
ncbi:MAG TPA: NAD(P)/FAD-dependent oxidoreductase [Ktedonobacterales bacterium]|nr:NAD(P)/FAD-dependent oxidoreductase [Ktedonobacterales bacterium]